MDGPDPVKQAQETRIRAVEICDVCGKRKAGSGGGDTEGGGVVLLEPTQLCSCASAEPQSVSPPESVHPHSEAVVPSAYGAVPGAVQEATLAESESLPDLGERWEVLNLIGQGGMGAVYRVRDRSLDKIFAVKVLKPELSHDKVSVKRFEQEAEAAKNLTHANLAAVYDYGVGRSGCPFLVMDYLEGNTLEKTLKTEGYLDSSRALEIFIQMAEAVADAHRKGVIHRDIKPSNIILEKAENGSDYVKLLDFGIAKVLPSQEEARNHLTQTGDIFGSPLYMSPEQCAGNMQDLRSDIYSLGCVMYEVLTGIQPFKDVNPIRTILRHINEDAAPISSLKPGYKVSSDLDKVIMHCLERDPVGRYRTADELVSDLKKIRDGEKLKLRQPLRPKSAGVAAQDGRKRLRLFLFAGVAAVISSAALVGALIVKNAPTGGPQSEYELAYNLDMQQAYAAFNQGKYEKAIPLLEYAARVDQERMDEAQAKNDQNAFLEALTRQSENYQHIGKIYLKWADRFTAGSVKKTEMLNLARQSYQRALAFYTRYGNYRGGMFSEFVTDYASVLKQLGLTKEFESLRQLAQRNGVSI